MTIILVKNGFKVVYSGTDTKFTRCDYDKKGNLIITATYYDCSIDKSVKVYLNNGWQQINL